jgi:hypothetical protein
MLIEIHIKYLRDDYEKSGSARQVIECRRFDLDAG